jgi:UDP-glucose 4-epimerase
LIPLALDVVLEVSDHLDLYGDDYPTPDGTCIRDYVHVLDLAEAHILAIEALADHKELVVNLGSGIGYSNRQVLDAVQRVTGVDFDVRIAPRRPGDPASAVADITIARTVLEWRPDHSALETIVADAWAARQFVHRSEGNLTS